MQEDTLFLFGCFSLKEQSSFHVVGQVMIVGLASCDGHFLAYSMHVPPLCLREWRLPKPTRTHTDSKNVSIHDVLAPT